MTIPSASRGALPSFSPSPSLRQLAPRSLRFQGVESSPSKPASPPAPVTAAPPGGGVTYGQKVLFKYPQLPALLDWLHKTFQQLKDFSLVQLTKARHLLEKVYVRAQEYLLFGMGAAYFLPLPAFAKRFLEERAFFAPTKVCSIRMLEDKSLKKSIEQVMFSMEDAAETQLSAWHIKAKPGKPTVLFHHGRNTNISEVEPLLKALRNKGFGVFAFDYPGFGKSEGQATEQALYESGLAASRYLAEREIPCAKQIVMGHSLGGAVAIHTAANMPEKPMALVVANTFTTVKEAFNSKKDEANSRFKWLLDHNKIELDFNSSKRIQSDALSDVPKLVMHADGDEVIAKKVGEELFEAAKKGSKLAEEHCQFHTLKNAGHKLKDAMCQDIGHHLETFVSRVVKPVVRHVA